MGANRQQGSRGRSHAGLEHREMVKEGGMQGRSGGAGEEVREALGKDVEDEGGDGDARRRKKGQAEMSMRPTRTGAPTPAAEERDGRSRGASRMCIGDGEETDGATAGGTRGEKRRARDAREEDGGMESGPETQRKESMNVKMISGTGLTCDRPKRRCKGRAAGEQTERRETGRGAQRRAAERIRYVGSGAGKGRIPLAQAIMVGRVCVVRTARTGEERTDAGWPSPDPG